MSDETKKSELSVEGHILKHKLPLPESENKNATVPNKPNNDGKPQPNDKPDDKPQQ